MSIRSFAAVAALFCLASAASATTGNPISGVGVSVEQSPGRIMMKSVDCKPPKGTLVQDAQGKWLCALSKPQLAPANGGKKS